MTRARPTAWVALPWLLLLAVLAAVAALDNGYVTTLAMVMILWALLGSGLNIIFGYGGLLHLGLGAFYGIGAYGAAMLGVTYDQPMWVALLVMPVVAALVGAAIGPLMLRTKGLHFAVATLALGMIVSDVTNNWVPVTGGPIGIAGIPRPGVLTIGRFVIDGSTTGGMFVITSAVFLLVLIFCALARHSRPVLILRSIKSDETYARSLGFETTRYKVAAFALAGAIAAIAGVLYAHIVQYISPEPFTFFASSFQAFVVVAVGGLGTLWGPVLGAVLLTALPELLDLDPQLRLIVYGLILLTVTIALPRGLVSIVRLLRIAPRPRAALSFPVVPKKAEE